MQLLLENKACSILTGFIFLFFSVQSQNLVPNGSFENFSSCPPNASNNLPYATYWTGPLINSTDYYNSCISPPTYGSIPFHGVYPRTGNAMAGFWGAFNCAPYYREYLQTTLTTTLSANKCYYIEMYVFPDKETKTFANNVAVHLSDTNYTINSTLQCGSNNMVLYLKPHILKFNNSVIMDTLNWTKISGIYTAKGGENYIIIGNFQDDYHTDSVRLGQSPYPAADYLIDDIIVIPTDSISLSPFAGNDTTIASGDSAFIGRQLYGLDCDWYNNGNLIDTNISGIWVKPTTTTSYVVEQNLCGNTGYDTVIVSVVGYANIKHWSDENNQIIIYPNPAQNRLQIEVNNTQATELKVFDVLGKEIINTKEKEIDISCLANGIYFLRIGNATKKFVVQH